MLSFRPNTVKLVGCCVDADFGRLVVPVVTDDTITVPVRPDPEPYLAAIRAYQQAGFDEI